MKRGTCKLLSMLVVLLLILTAVVGCGGSKSDDTANPSDDTTQEQDVQDNTGDEGDTSDTTEETSEDVEEPEVALDLQGRVIKYAAWWDLTPQPGSLEADRKIERINKLEEKYNFKMEYVNLSGGQYTETYIASSLAGDPFADIAFVASDSFFPGLATKGFCYPINELEAFDLSEDKWNDFAIKVGSWDGNIYGWEIGNLWPSGGIFWNKTMFEREGLPNLYELQNSKQWTWDKFLDIAQKATKDLDGDGILDQWGFVGDFRVVWAFIASNNGELFKMADNKPVFSLNEPNSIQALQLVQDLVVAHKALPLPPEGASWDWPIIQFQDGRVAMHGGEFWEAGGFQSNMADDYGYVVYPMGPNKTDKYVHVSCQVNVQTMPAGVKNPQELAVVWDEMTDPYPDEDPEAWRDSVANSSRDMETVDTVGMIWEGKDVESVWMQSYLMGPVNGLGWDTVKFVATGEKTAQVAIEEVAQMAQATLNDAFQIEE